MRPRGRRRDGSSRTRAHPRRDETSRSRAHPPRGPGRRAALALVVLALGGCAGSASRAAPASPTPSTEVPTALQWTRTSAEHDGLFRQVYAQAGAQVARLSAGLEEGRWAVILDADETLLDNSDYQLRLARRGEGFTPESWTAWVLEEAAPALPGARDFTRRVRALGGRVAVVTNRAAHGCEATRRNLDAVGVEATVVLCRSPGEEGKEGRFRMVREGTTPAGLPPLEVVAWVGDNIRDFPGGAQARRGDPSFLARFGERYFLLPNPMYGSWEGNPPRQEGDGKGE